MTDTNAAIAVYDTHSAAENALKELQKSGFDMKKLSIVGKDYHTDDPGGEGQEVVEEVIVCPACAAKNGQH